MSKTASFKNWFAKNEKYLSPLVLISGFVLDNLTLRRADLLLENLLLITYLIIIATFIALVSFYDSGILKWKIWGSFRPWMTLIIQFAFGNLFSGFTVFYLRSSSLSTSWPFLAFLVAIMVSTEFAKKVYTRLTIQVTVLYLAIFSFLIYILPVLVKKIGTPIFLLSGGVSLLIIHFYLLFLKFGLKNKFKTDGKYLKRAVIIMFLIINFFYFTNIIPPIPLSMQEMGAYNSVTKKSAGEYVLNRTERNWLDYLLFRNEIILKKGASAYFFSSVYSPTALNTKIYHDWQYYDVAKNRWISTGRVGFPIVGGRAEGYRGYTFKNNISAGLWRVDVETENGQIIGREKFSVKLTK